MHTIQKEYAPDIRRTKLKDEVTGCGRITVTSKHGGMLQEKT
jgi:hypothetical protein